MTAAMRPAATSVPRNHAKARIAWTPPALGGGQAVESAHGGGDRRVDVGARMGRGHEARLERRGREVHALLQHPMKEALEALGIARHHLGKAVHLAFLREEQPE